MLMVFVRIFQYCFTYDKYMFIKDIINITYSYYSNDRIANNINKH